MGTILDTDVGILLGTCKGGTVFTLLGDMLPIKDGEVE